MSDTTTTETKVATEAPKQEAPKVDIAAITKQVQDAANKSIEDAGRRMEKANAEKFKEASRLFSGESAPNQQNEVLVDFAKDPVKVLAAVADIAATKAVKEINSTRDVEKLQQKVGAKFIDEFPELKSPKKLALVEKLTDDYQSQGLSYSEALNKGFEDTVKEFGLKSVSDAERSGGYSRTGLPGGGGMTPGVARVPEAKQQSDFISSLKARHNGFRVKK